MATNTSNEVKKFTTSIDVPEDVREKMNDLLNQHLADVFDLYSQVKQAHWNVKGMQFYFLHELFDELAARVLEYVDMIAERVTTLGGLALGTVRMSADNSQLDEFPTVAPDGSTLDGRNMVELLVQRYASYAELARTAIDTADAAGDMDTADLFTEISRTVDKDLWFLEAHLQA